MFDLFTSVPHTLEEAQNEMRAFAEIQDKLNTVISTEKRRLAWNVEYQMLSLANVLNTLSALRVKDDEYFVTRYSADDAYYFDSEFINETNDYGIVINREAGTHFIDSNYTGGQFLQAASEHLKQSQHHFLNIMTSPYNKKLFVWTNKALEPETVYKLFLLEASINEAQESLAYKFITALTEDNAAKAKRYLTDFMASDAVQQIAFENFKQCMQNTHNVKINTIMNEIRNRRNLINDYEGQIAVYASEIRKKNEELDFLRSTDDEEDQKLLWKHLNRVPYITKFEGNREGYIYLNYEAPLLYFADYPAEKLISASYTSTEYKNILRAIISRKYELWTKCKLEFNTSTFAVENATRNAEGSPNLIPHPHIARYACFGNHRQAIAESAEAGDYIGAVEQMTQAVLNLNFYDTCVIDTMVSVLLDGGKKPWKCVETGEWLSTREVFERGDYYEEA